MGDLAREQLGELDYTIEKVHFIRTAIAGYVGGAAIVSELAQNADDALAKWLRLQFSSEALFVQNSGVFSEKDFKNITHIASGGKREDEKTIGTWGTGFLSVYQITDHPELESAGRYIRFDPTKEKIPYYQSDVGDETRFRFRWRRERTPLALELEADPWPIPRIAAFKDELAVEIYRQILFLRTVKTIEVLDGDDQPKLLYRVHKKRTEDTLWNLGYTREVFEISYYRRGQKEVKDKWVYYRGYVPEECVPEGYKVKDSEVCIAFPLTKRTWLTENMPGHLYNFLPTQIRTGFSFQINGAFAPKSDRTTILMDTSIKADWNRQLIRRLAQLFTDVLDDIRDTVGDDPRSFYELFPLEYNQDYPFLETIRNQFAKNSPNKRLVYSSMDQWETPDKINVGGPVKLQKLFDKHIPLLPLGATQEFRSFLSNELERPPLGLKDALTCLSAHLNSGMPLEQAPIVENYSNLAVIFQIAQQDWSRLSQPYDKNILRRQLEAVPICLDDQGVLRNFSDQIWLADDEVRHLVPSGDICFVDERLQAEFSTLLADFLEKFTGSELLNYLHDKLVDSHSNPLRSAHEIINNRKKLQNNLHFLYQSLDQLPVHQLANTPLVLDEQDRLRTAQDKVYFYDDSYQRQLLTSLNLVFVAQSLIRDEKVLAVYHRAGVSKLSLRYVISRLEQLCPSPTPLAQAPSSIADIKILRDLYNFFAHYSHDLETADKNKLRQLPIFLTQEERLAAIDDPHTPLKLPARTKGEWQSSLDVLGLDNLIHSDTLNGRIRQFFDEVLSVEELSPFVIIRDYLLQHYNDDRLSHRDRLNLLDFVRITWDSLDQEQRQELDLALKKTPLICCHDGEYRCGGDVYFASPALDTIFVSAYIYPHQDYGLPKADPKDIEQRPYVQKKWYRLFRQLGLKEQPAPVDLIDAVNRVVSAGPPTEERIDAIRRVYNLLKDEVGQLYRLDDPVLITLRDIAWLPASNDSYWHKPSEIYPPRFTQLVGTQSPVLQFREYENTNQLLDLPTKVPVLLVIKHLRDSAKKTERVHLSIYQYLGMHLDEISPPILQVLKKEAVVWDHNDDFRLASQMFFVDHSYLFGTRRWYLPSPNDVEARKFLETIGVRNHYHPWQDTITLIQEIAADYSHGQPMKDEDFELLLRNFDHLGQQLPNGDNHFLVELQNLRSLAIIPGRDKVLYLPDHIVLADQPDTLKRFIDEDAIPAVDENDGLSEATNRFLHWMKVPQLSKIVKRRAISTKGSQEDAVFNLRMENLATAFDRIELTIREDSNNYTQDNLPSERLKDIHFFVVPQLKVGYSLELGGKKYTGDEYPEPALYDVDTRFFYVEQKQGGRISEKSHRPLAKELERVFFPNARQGIVIEQLLKMEPAEIDSFLTEYDYRQLPSGTTKQTENSESKNLGAWTDETPALWKSPDASKEKTPEPSPVSTPAQEPTSTPPPNSSPSNTDEPVTEPKPDISPPPEAEETEEVEGEKNDLEPVTPQPDDNDTPPTSETTTPPDDKTPRRDNDKTLRIPSFTGQRWPISIRGTNDYTRLSSEFGLSAVNNNDEWDEAIQTVDDTEWESEKPEAKDKTAPITTVRFTLKYQNRYEGFLPLHSRARQMLVGQPKVLTCLTDYPDEWKFDLFVDYGNPGMIYNEDKLPQFFDAFNIPAGGIVYLERLETHNTVRLFWKNVEQTIRKVKRYEINEDGTVDEFSADVKVFCEVDERILRAETRLEDIGAFITKSIGQPGVFELICDAFKDLGSNELSYNAISDYVQARRPVADFTIRAELYGRPCFVSEDNGLWRFDPKRKTKPRDTPAKKTGMKSTNGRAIPQTPHTSGSEVTEAEKEEPDNDSIHPPSASPYQQLLADIQQEWQALGAILHPNSSDPRIQLPRFHQELVTLEQRLQGDLTTLADSEIEIDDGLSLLWEQVVKNPGDKESQRNLEIYIIEQIITTYPNAITQLKAKLAPTSLHLRSQLFLPLLSRIAEKIFEQGKTSSAKSLYLLLQEQGGGSFESQLTKIKQSEDVQEFINMAHQADTLEDSWTIWGEAWKDYEGLPILKQSIQAELAETVPVTEREINQRLHQQQLVQAKQQYTTFLEYIMQVWQAWQADSKISVRIWGLARNLFESFMDTAQRKDDPEIYRQALHTLNLIPISTKFQLSGDSYLEAVLSVAQHIESQPSKDDLAAAALLEYGLYWSRHHQCTADKYTLSKVRENMARLLENAGFVNRAYFFVQQAQQQATGERKMKLVHIGNELNQKRKTTDKKAELQNWREQTMALLENNSFSELVNPQLFQKMVTTAN